MTGYDRGMREMGRVGQCTDMEVLTKTYTVSISVKQRTWSPWIRVQTAADQHRPSWGRERGTVPEMSVCGRESARTRRLRGKPGTNWWWINSCLDRDQCRSTRCQILTGVCWWRLQLKHTRCQKVTLTRQPVVKAANPPSWHKAKGNILDLYKIFTCKWKCIFHFAL